MKVIEMKNRAKSIIALTAVAFCAACTTTTPANKATTDNTVSKTASSNAASKPPRPAGGHGLNAIIGSYDVNNDGIVTREEFDSVRLERFRRGDTNGDGWLSEAEYIAEYESRLKQQYFDDGKEPDEFYERAIKQAGVRFAIVDRDRDGKYTLAEDKAIGDKTFSAADTNGDGVISKEDPPRQRQTNDDDAKDDNKANAK